jgi:transcription elongation factor SPT6
VIDNWLRSYVLAHPGKSNYAFGIDRNRPGYFVLDFLNKSESEGGSIQNWVRILSLVQIVIPS